MKRRIFKTAELRMADVTAKKPTVREATASGEILLTKETMKLVKSGRAPKGDIFTTAEIAGINAAKQTQFLIPLCHNIGLTHCGINFSTGAESIKAVATVKTKNRTGVEMEALAAVSAALLTIYDMLKPLDKSMVISGIKLMEKKGGKSGHWKRS